ncbi:1703_t:CDS:2 [Paraglomus brasilianum]|uniref:1703_t:CDS:1 n=1 Tax=Paraglomus brasilianum TaxID=144538 RepID=A0A9N9FQD2_9GLOM|nr:1703_t:CDS:2 [Paraglomus brasilianum]
MTSLGYHKYLIVRYSFAVNSSQWTHNNDADMFIVLENMYSSDALARSTGEPLLKITRRNDELECVNLSYSTLNPRALMKYPVFGLKYHQNYQNSLQQRKFQVKFIDTDDYIECGRIVSRYINCKFIRSNDQSLSQKNNTKPQFTATMQPTSNFLASNEQGIKSEANMTKNRPTVHLPIKSNTQNITDNHNYIPQSNISLPASFAQLNNEKQPPASQISLPLANHSYNIAVSSNATPEEPQVGIIKNQRQTATTTNPFSFACHDNHTTYDRYQPSVSTKSHTMSNAVCLCAPSYQSMHTDHLSRSLGLLRCIPEDNRRVKTEEERQGGTTVGWQSVIDLISDDEGDDVLDTSISSHTGLSSPSYPIHDAILKEWMINILQDPEFPLLVERVNTILKST